MEKFLKNLSLGAGKIIREGFGSTLKIDVKKNAGLVTDIDKKTEDYIISTIIKEYPESSILAEESGEMNKSESLKWIIDPLDGTSNFAHGFPWFCVSIGVEIDSEIKYGAIYNPILDELFYAQQGKGAFLNDKQINVSKVARLEDSMVATGFSYLKDEPLKVEVERFRRVQQVALAVRRAGSAALDFAHVAAGRFSGFWEFGLNPWDMAAGFLLINEAGGKITSYTGGEVSVYDQHFVASNSLIHDELVETIKGL